MSTLNGVYKERIGGSNPMRVKPQSGMRKMRSCREFKHGSCFLAFSSKSNLLTVLFSFIVLRFFPLGTTVSSDASITLPPIHSLSTVLQKQMSTVKAQMKTGFPMLSLA